MDWMNELSSVLMLLTPRMLMLMPRLPTCPSWVKETLGVRLRKWAASVMLELRSASPVKAVTLTGTSCRLCSRRCAVTTTSSRMRSES